MDAVSTYHAQYSEFWVINAFFFPIFFLQIFVRPKFLLVDFIYNKTAFYKKPTTDVMSM